MADDPPAYPPPQPLAPQAPAAPGAPPPAFTSTVHGSGSPNAIQVPKRKGRIRWGVLLLGVLAAAAGLVSLVVGAGFLLAEGAVNIADSEADGRLPDADLSFDAEDAQYDIFLSGRGTTEFDSEDVSCAITLADGEQLEVRGDQQVVSTSGATVSVGSFDAVEGFTEVRCTSTDDNEVSRIYLGKDRAWLERTGYVGLGMGLLLVLGGTGLILLAVFKRKPPKGPGYTPVPGPNPAAMA